MVEPVSSKIIVTADYYNKLILKDVIYIIKMSRYLNTLTVISKCWSSYITQLLVSRHKNLDF
jgi:hypothetical protein